MPRIDALIFDLDNTLVPELANYERAFNDACTDAAAREGLDLDRLRDTVFTISAEMWRRSPGFDYCTALGIDSPTSLLSDFADGTPELVGLREWARAYRSRCWSDALTRLGIGRTASATLAQELDVAFRRRQRRECASYADARPALEQLHGDVRLAVVTNGPPDTQESKLRASGLWDFFAVTVSSGAVGIGKPDPRIFGIALDRLDVDGAATLVIGDTQARDIAGARNAGLACVWLNRDGTRLTQDPFADFEISTLDQLPAVVTRLNRSR